MYIIIKYNYKTKIEDIYKYLFNCKWDATNFIRSKMTKEEIEKTENAQKRGLITENEFLTSENNYKIIKLQKYNFEME